MLIWNGKFWNYIMVIDWVLAQCNVSGLILRISNHNDGFKIKLTCPGGGIPSHPPRLIALVVNRLTAMMFRPRTDILNLWVQNILYKLHEKRQLNLCYKYYWMLRRCEKKEYKKMMGSLIWDFVEYLLKYWCRTSIPFRTWVAKK